MPSPVKWRRAAVDSLTGRPDYGLVGVLRIPDRVSSPWRAIAIRVAIAFATLFAAAAIVYLGRAGYRDVQGGEISFLDAMYYATVSLSTTGYGDITPITPGARLTNILVITPLRVFFLVLLVGTTLAVLTERSRQTLKIQRWRRRVREHTIVVGYGTKGRSAVQAILADGTPASQIVVVDTDTAALDAAANAGLVTVHGSATRSDVLRLAGAHHARAIVIATSRDDTAVLVTLTARQIAARAQIIAAIREAENTHLLRQSGADSVVVSSETAGRLLGLATSTPTVVEMIEDLLTAEDGFVIAERDIEHFEVRTDPRQLPDIVLGIVRGGALHRVGEGSVDRLKSGDRLLYVKNTTS